jgi:pyruvate kinase
MRPSRRPSERIARELLEQRRDRYAVNLSHADFACCSSLKWRSRLSRRARIVATLGPATDPPGVLEAILEAGVDVARINFSHGSAEEHAERIDRLRRAARQVAHPIAVLADLPGPKLRAVLKAPLPLEAGRDVTFACAPSAVADIGVTEHESTREVQPRQRILLDDGRLQLLALRTDGELLVARVEVGGLLLPGKGINLPDTLLSIPALTARDREALAAAAAAGVDWLALSFVRSAGAAQELRTAAREHGLSVPVLAKIERPEAVRHSRDIIEAFDGIMVARGDLGVEIPLERVPHVQKRLIKQARAAGKPVVTATDMLDSMRTNPRPTRAEASDVANAIEDGTGAVMLSGETAVGQYPVEAVAYMDRIIRETEAHLLHDSRHDILEARGPIEDHITHATCALARELHADAIVAPTYSGKTARLVARHRPRAAIVAPAPTEAVVRQLALVWGLTPVRMAENLSPGDDRLNSAVRAAFAKGALKVGDLAVLLAGHPVEGGEHFPTIRVVRVGVGGRSCSP